MSKRFQIMLKETMDAIKHFRSRYDDDSAEDTRKLHDLKRLLDALYRDRSDAAVITECVAALDRYIRSRFIDSFEDLPEAAQSGITRLVNKFGMFCPSFLK